MRSCKIYIGDLTSEEDEEGSLAGSGSAIESPLRNIGSSVTESLSSRILRSNSLGFAVSQWSTQTERKTIMKVSKWGL
jgi:hypothetical protein